MTPTTPVVIATGRSSFGMRLRNGDGETVYTFSADVRNQSRCGRTCTRTWLPVVSLGGKPRSGSGVAQTDLGSIQRPDGTIQITFRGHPLYYFVKDAAPGSTKGQGLTQFGGSWSAKFPTTKPAGHGQGRAS